MPNSRHYTSTDVKKIFEYAVSKINFTEEGLTRDTGCTPNIDHTNDKYVDSVIQYIKEQNDQPFAKEHNSHDWAKILKHVFQNGQIINFTNIEVFKEWREFSTYSRDVFLEKENPNKPKEYVSELKKFMAKLINHGAVKEVSCLHLMLNFAYKVYSQDITTTNTSETVASMLCSSFYDGLQLEGIIKAHTLFDMDSQHSREYIQRAKACACFLKAIIEDPLFSSGFKKTDYAEYLMKPKLEKVSGSEKAYVRNKRSHSLENNSTLDPDFIEAFKSFSIRTSQSNPEIPSKKNTEVTFSYSSGQKVASGFKEENEREIQAEETKKDKKEKKRISLSIFTK